jgi:hypothetical protein
MSRKQVRTRATYPLKVINTAVCIAGMSRYGTKSMPNHSVNLTRNSVPHLPGSARYAHNALPGKRVTLPRAGYLKR